MRIANYVLIAAIFGSSLQAGHAAGWQWPLQGAQLGRPQPPAAIPEDEDQGPVIVAQDSSGLVLRIDRLENQVRSLTGQIEQMQFQQRKMEEALRRLQDAAPVAGLDASGKPLARPPLGRKPSGDAFDPAANPNAPGAPRPLGAPYGLAQPSAVPPAIQPSAPPRAALPSGPVQLEPDDAQKPLDLGQQRPPADPLASAPPRIIALNPGAAPPAANGIITDPAALPAKPLSDYDLGVNLYRQGQYASAESSLSAFLQKNPRDRYVPDAVFYLGETFFQQKRHREAAEQYLKVSTDFSKSRVAPDALVRLGMSLHALGAKEQACATFGEVGRKYPDAKAAVRGADRESKKAQC